MKIKIISPEPNHAEPWADALVASNGSFQVESILRPLRAVHVIVNGSRPDVVVAETADARDFVTLEALANAHPDVDFILVGTDLSPDVLMRAMRAGVREVLPGPASPDVVVAAVQRLARKRLQASAPVLKVDGQVLAFISCKGGSGATFAAANLASMLTQGGKRRVALIDLNLQFGDAQWFISSEQPTSNVADVARNIERLDRELLQSAMTPVSPGLFVLSSPDDPAHATDVTPAHVEAIVGLARTMFDHVVIDAGRSLTGVTLQALDLADHVYPVLQLTLPYIRDGKRLRQVFVSLGYPEDKVQWVVNRYEKKSQITLDDLRRTLELTDVITLPNQYEAVATSVNQGVPVAVVAPNNPITKSLRALAEKLAPLPKDARGGWFANLMPTAKRGADAAPARRLS